MNDFLGWGFISLPWTIALVLGFAAPVAVWITYRAITWLGERYVIPVSVWIIGLYPAVYAILTPRILTKDEKYFSDTALTAGAYSIWLARGLTVVIVVIALASIIPALVRGESSRRPGRSLWFGFLAYFILSFVLSAIGATEPSFKHQLLYPLLIFATVFLVSPPSPADFLKVVKRVLLLIIYASAVAAVAVPGWALYDDIWAVFPGIPRLFGVTSHPNVLGPLAALYLVIELFRPASHWIRVPNVMVSVAVLFLSQSKTSWAIVLLALMVWLAVRLWRGIDLGLSGDQIWQRALFGAFAAGGFALVAVFAAFVAGAFDRFQLDNLEGLTTLTGRTTIWNITLDVWLDNPLFGYGQELWGDAFRAKYRLLFVGQAHNQFIQTLGESGIIGTAGLLIYLGVLALLSIRHARATNGLSVSLFLMLILRSITETPLQNTILFDGNFFMHLVIFAYLMVLEKQSALEKSALADKGGSEARGAPGWARSSANS